MTLRPYHIYFSNAERKNGYLYDEKLGIFCLLDKHELSGPLQRGHLTSSIEDISSRLRNYPDRELPVGFGKMLDLTTGELRERGPGDGATYFLEPPQDNSALEELLGRVTPDLSRLRDFLYRALIGTAAYETLLLQGAGANLFPYLDALYPLLYRPKDAFFRRPELGAQLLEEVSGRKLLYGGNPDWTHRRPRGLGGVPLCTLATTVSLGCDDRLVTVTVRPEEGEKLPYLPQGEILAWIASSKRS